MSPSSLPPHPARPAGGPPDVWPPPPQDWLLQGPLPPGQAPLPPGQGPLPPGQAPLPPGQGPLPPGQGQPGPGAPWPGAPDGSPWEPPPDAWAPPTGAWAPTGYGAPEPWGPAPGVGPTTPVGRPTPPRRRRARWPWLLLTLVVAVVAVGGWANVLGVRERAEHVWDRIDLALHPPADRSGVPTIQVTPPPGEQPDDGDVAAADPSDEVVLTLEPDPSPTATPGSTAGAITSGPAATDGPTPTPRPTRSPVRRPVRMTLDAANPKTTFVSQVDNTMCAPAGLQMVLAMHRQAPTTDAFQRRLHGRLDEWETRADAKAGGWGPSAMAEALAAYGVKGYEVRAYQNRNQALREAAVAMTRTGAPAIVVAWRGAHTWIMTGFRADGDPTVFADARITGIEVFDPWYPRVSTIWGASDPPGTLQDLDEIKRNVLQWDRPEGRYADRDGTYIVVVPTIPLRDQRGNVARG